MKQFIFVVLLLFCTFTFFSTEENETCNKNLSRARLVLVNLPENFKQTLSAEILQVMAQVFARVDYEITEKFVRGLFVKSVKTEDLCKVWTEIYVPELERQQKCLQKCIDDADISWARILAILLKCQTKIECYREELGKMLDEILPCAMRCISGEGKKDQLVFAVEKDVEGSEAAIAQYWNKENMMNAIPFHLELDDSEKKSELREPTDTRFVDDADYSKKPYAQTGKVFFTMNGRNYVCSGSANGNNAVLTAGHCVSDGRGKFHTNWVFVPQFKAGDSPFGKWVAKRLVTFDSWHRRQDLGRDFGWGIVNPNENGQNLEQVVGKLGFTRCKRGDSVTAIGYPVPEFGGQKMVRTKQTITLNNSRFRPASIGIISPMKGGCSGGPWVFGNDGSDACGVNSYGYTGRDDLYSPSVDSEVEEMQKSAVSQN